MNAYISRFVLDAQMMCAGGLFFCNLPRVLRSIAAQINALRQGREKCVGK